MKKIAALGIIIFLLIVIRNLIMSISSLSGETTVTSLKSELDEKKKENAFLKQQLKNVQTEAFIEQEARNKLGLVKEGEYIVLLPPPEEEQQKAKIKDKPNWQKWWDLFF
jgi:cell division protein DivIC